MGSIHRRITSDGKVKYLARSRVRGRIDKSKTFDKQADAKRWLSLMDVDARAQRLGADTVGERTVAEMLDRYMENVLPNKSHKPRFIAGQKQQLTWWRGRIGKLRLDELNRFVLAAARDDLKKDGGVIRKPSTINRYLAALNHAINIAIEEWGWLAANPLQAVKKAAEPPCITNFLQVEQLPALLKAAEKVTTKPLRLLVLMAVSTGARKGELLGLKCADIDLSRKVAVVYDTKNGEARQLHISGKLVDVVSAQLSRLPTGSKYFFRSRTTDHPIEIDREWRKARKMAGVGHLRFHDLRHTTASWLAMLKGASLAEIAEVLGHKSITVTKRYSHLTTSHTANVVADMNDIAFAGLSPG